MLLSCYNCNKKGHTSRKCLYNSKNLLKACNKLSASDVWWWDYYLKIYCDDDIQNQIKFLKNKKTLREPIIAINTPSLMRIILKYHPQILDLKIHIRSSFGDKYSENTNLYQYIHNKKCLDMYSKYKNTIQK